MNETNDCVYLGEADDDLLNMLGYNSIQVDVADGKQILGDVISVHLFLMLCESVSAYKL